MCTHYSGVTYRKKYLSSGRIVLVFLGCDWIFLGSCHAPGIDGVCPCGRTASLAGVLSSGELAVVRLGCEEAVGSIVGNPPTNSTPFDGIDVIVEVRRTGVFIVFDLLRGLLLGPRPNTDLTIYCNNQHSAGQLT